MKYKAVYDVLNERRQTTPGFCYHDRSGWRAYPQTYMTMQCPLLLPVLLEKNIYKFDKRQSTLPQIDYLQF